MSSQIYDTPVCLWINDKYRDNINHIPFKKRSYSKGDTAVIYERTVCKSCSEQIADDDLVFRLNTTWHTSCFRCKFCKHILYSWYFAHDYDLYCHNDFKNTFCNLCNFCATNISGPIMVYYLSLVECIGTILNDNIAIYSPHTSSFHSNLHYNIVPRSSDEFTVAGEHNYHPECFRCRKCEKLIGDNEEFTLRERCLLYCGSCDVTSSPGHIIRLLRLSRSVGSGTCRQRRSIEITSSNVMHNSSRRWRHYTDSPGIVKITSIDKNIRVIQVGDIILDINGNMLDPDISKIKQTLELGEALSMTIERDAKSAAVATVPQAKSFDDPTTDDEQQQQIGDAPYDHSPRRCARASSLPSDHPYNSPNKTPPSTAIGRTQSVRISKGQQFRPQELKMIRVLGRGGYGVAYLMEHRKTGAKMVTKELLNFRTDDKKATDDFTMEVRTLKELNNPYVLKYIGFWLNPLTLVTEYAPGGTLKERLLDTSIPLCWIDRVNYASNIAEGMAYLHANKIIHRDLNSNNCLINNLGKVIVADFGGISLSHEGNSYENGISKSRSRYLQKRFRNQSRCGIGFWSAPEMLDLQRLCPYDQRVDIYSYGIVVCEIIGRVYADPDLLPRKNNFDLDYIKFYKLFCDVQKCPLPFFNLARICAQMNRDDRPAFDRIVSLLKSIRFALESGSASVPAPLKRFTPPTREQMDDINLSEVTDMRMLDDAHFVPVLSDAHFSTTRNGHRSPRSKKLATPTMTLNGLSQVGEESSSPVDDKEPPPAPPRPIGDEPEELNNDDFADVDFSLEEEDIEELFSSEEQFLKQSSSSSGGYGDVYGVLPLLPERGVCLKSSSRGDLVQRDTTIISNRGGYDNDKDSDTSINVTRKKAVVERNGDIINHIADSEDSITKTGVNINNIAHDKVHIADEIISMRSNNIDRINKAKDHNMTKSYEMDASYLGDPIIKPYNVRFNNNNEEASDCNGTSIKVNDLKHIPKLSDSRQSKSFLRSSVEDNSKTIETGQISRLTALFESKQKILKTPQRSPVHVSRPIKRPDSLAVSLPDSEKGSAVSVVCGRGQSLQSPVLTCSDVPLITVRRRVDHIYLSSPDNPCSITTPPPHIARKTFTSEDVYIEAALSGVKGRIAAYEVLINSRSLF